jgi:exoribonuclease-2
MGRVPYLLNHDDHDLNVLYNIASHLTQMRLESGAVQIQKGDASVSLSEDGSMSLQEIDEQSPARSLVGEMMVLANSIMAECAAANDVPLIFRGQPHPDRNRSIDPLIPDGPARDYAQRSLLKKSTVSTSPEPHASLGLKAYAQITSPIRRYADIVNQKQLLCWLSTGQPYFTHSDLQEIIHDTEETLSRANQISRESKRFWLLRYIEEHRHDATLLCGTVIRTDLKFPIVELDRTYLTVQARCHNAVRLGERVRLKLNSIKPAFDEIRVEQV